MPAGKCGHIQRTPKGLSGIQMRRCGDGRAKLGMPNTVPRNRSTMQNASKKHSMTSRQREGRAEGEETAGCMMRNADDALKAVGVAIFGVPSGQTMKISLPQ